MKRIAIVWTSMLALSAGAAASAQFGNTVSTWAKRHGAGTPTSINRIIRTNDGQFVTAGAVGSSAALRMAGLARRNTQLMKIDAGGAVIWARPFTPFGPQVSTSANDVVEDGSGGFVIAGNTDIDTRDIPVGYLVNETARGFDDDDDDAFVMRVAADGSQLWARRYGAELDDEARGLLPALDGGYVVIGSTTSGAAGARTRTGWLMKLDTDGNFVGESRFTDFVPADIVALADGYLMAGGTADWGGLVKVDAAGQVVWRQELTDQIPGRLHRVDDDRIVVAGGDRAIQGKRYMPALSLVTAEGEVHWSRTLNYQDHYQVGAGALLADDEGILIGGSYRTQRGYAGAAHVTRLGWDGSPLWVRVIQGSKRDTASYLTGLTSSSDGGFVGVGAIDEQFHPVRDGSATWESEGLVVKFDGLGHGPYLSEKAVDLVAALSPVEAAQLAEPASQRGGSVGGGLLKRFGSLMNR